jgi:hypothetical protein
MKSDFKYHDRLNKKQVEDLYYLIEEEKMAHDIYIALCNKWQHRRFRNILESESRHLEVLKLLFERYDLGLPARFEKPGEFENARIQDSYYRLLSDGLSSLAQAMNVGRKIECDDIRDLKKIIARGTPEVKQVLMRLLEASQRHLKAFERD